MPSQLSYSEYGAMPAPAPVRKQSIKASIIVRGWNWIKYVFTCCGKSKNVEEPVLPVHDPSMPGEKPAIYQTEGGMIMWDPNSGAPCPHAMSQTNPRTGRVICIGCRKVLVEGKGE